MSTEDDTGIRRLKEAVTDKNSYKIILDDGKMKFQFEIAKALNVLDISYINFFAKTLFESGLVN